MDDYKIIVEQEHQTVMAHYDVMPKAAEGYQSEAKLEHDLINQLMGQGYVYVVVKNEEGLLRNLREQQRIVSILDTFEASIQNLEAQLSQREKQYEYYRNKLLTFE